MIYYNKCNKCIRVYDVFLDSTASLNIHILGILNRLVHLATAPPMIAATFVYVVRSIYRIPFFMFATFGTHSTHFLLKTQMDGSLLTYDIYALLITKYAHACDAVRLMMTCKRLYSQFFPRVISIVADWNKTRERLFMSIKHQRGHLFCDICRGYHFTDRCTLAFNLDISVDNPLRELIMDESQRGPLEFTRYFSSSGIFVKCKTSKTGRSFGMHRWGAQSRAPSVQDA